MKILIKTFLIMAIIIAFYACEDPGISDGEVISFTVDGIVGDAVINSVSKNINLTLEPMDISTIDNPTIITSEGATFQVPTLQDGVAVEFNVTAADGTVEVWSVTATVQYGVSFIVDGNKIVFTEGCHDSREPGYSDAQLVGNDPFMFNDGVHIGGKANLINTEFTEMSDDYPDTIAFALDPVTLKCEMFFYIDDFTAYDNCITYSSDSASGSETEIIFSNLSIVKTHTAVCTGTFTGVTDSYNPDYFVINTEDISLTNGFFKLKWLDASQL